MHALLPTSEEEPIHCSLLYFLEQTVHPVPLAFWLERGQPWEPDNEATEANEANIQRYLDDRGTSTGILEETLLEAHITSFGLYKHRSWIEWYHEFVVLTITHEGQEYLIHFNRAWAAPDGWRQYIPPINWGSQKPSNDEVAIYLPGKLETVARHNTYVVASFDVAETLSLAHQHLLGMWQDHPEYSLIGLNCWAFSRSFAWALLYRSMNPPAINGFIMGRPGSASQDDLLVFLSESGPWALIPLVTTVLQLPVDYGHPTYKGLRYRVEFIIEAILHGSKLYRHIRGDSQGVNLFLKPGGSGSFRRHKRIRVTSSGFISNQTAGHEIPHSFGPLGIAYDTPTAPHVNSICGPGEFLYILTEPIVPPLELAIPRFCISVVVTGTELEEYDGVRGTGGPTPWLEYGLVRQDDQDGHLDITYRRTLPAYEGPWPRPDNPLFVLNVLVRDFRPNDRMAVWVRGPPANVASCQWSMTVAAAHIIIHWQNFFKESRGTLIKSSPQNPPDDSQQVVGPPSRDIWPFSGVRSKFEFGRMKHILTAQARSSSIAPGGEDSDCTWSGAPHSFNGSGLAFDLDVPKYSTTLCEPGSFLYILTPQIQLTPKNHVLCVTVYTWGLPFCVGKTVASPPLSFEVGAVRATAQGGLEPISPRYEISTDFPLVTGYISQVETRHRYHMDDNHPFVRSLKAGDMIGLWLRVRDRASGYAAKRALIVVETGPEVGVAGRYMRLVGEEIRDVALKIEAPRWAPVLGAVALAGALFAGFSRAFRRL